MFGFFGKRGGDEGLELPARQVGGVRTSGRKPPAQEPAFVDKGRVAPPPVRNASSSGARVVANTAAPHTQTASTVEFGGVRFADTEMETIGDLAQVFFHDVVNKQVHLAAHLYSRLAVVTVNAKDRTVYLFCDRSKAKPDEIMGVVGSLKSQGYSLPETGPQGFFAQSSLVLGLSQGHHNSQSLKLERDIRGDREKSALMASFVDIVTWAYLNRADDIDFAVEQGANRSQIAFKIGGRYIRPERFNVATETLIQMLGIAWQKSRGGASSTFEIQTEQQAQISLDLPKNKDMPDGARVRLRWSGLPNDKGTVVTCRIQRLGESALIANLEEAGYLDWHLEIMKRVLRSEGGATVLSGVVGSGKSTTLARMIQMLPTDIKIISFEDPVELEIKNAHQRTITRSLTATGPDEGFIAATRALFRSALDVLYLGEIRDQETGLVARQIVESGHSVYTTVHAKSAPGIFNRFASPAIGIPVDVLATPGIFKLGVYQSLLPKTCPHCGLAPDDYAHAFHLSGAALNAHQVYFKRLYDMYNIEPSRFRMVNEHGCEHCRKPDLPELNGLNGRTVVAEMIEPDEQMLEFVAKNDWINLQRYWRSLASPDVTDPNLEGKTAMECALYKAAQGIIDPREIEPRFSTFESIQSKQLAEKARKMHLHSAA